MNRPSLNAAATLNTKLIELVESLSALYALAEIPVGKIDESDLLYQALAALMENQDVERSPVFLFDDSGETLVNAAGCGWDDILDDLVGGPGSDRR